MQIINYRLSYTNNNANNNDNDNNNNNSNKNDNDNNEDNNNYIDIQFIFSSFKYYLCLKRTFIFFKFLLQGWSLQDAMLACNQMGLVADDLEGWQFMPPMSVDPATSMLPIYRSYVQCNNFDTNLLDCIADSEYDHSCDHSQDVYLKCRPPSWGGEFLSDH